MIELATDQVIVASCAGVLALLWVVQAIPALLFCRQLWRARPATVTKSWQPKFCIGLPLRGADPNLKSAIARLLAQDYPDFELRIIVDSTTDPAWELAHQAVRELGAANVKISALKGTSNCCSRYCSSLAQYLDEVDDSCELIGFADADMLVPYDWLACMAAALADPSVGATLGNRWYVPVGTRWGTLVRYIWNAGAVVPMWMAQMPWTGALAMRRETVIRTGLIEKLRHGMTEDTPVKSAVESLGLTLKFVPLLMIPNCEETDLAPCFRFIQRQLLWTRLYHPHWSFVVLNAIGGAATFYLPLFLSIALLLRGATSTGLMVGGIVIAYLIGLILIVCMLDRSMRRVMRNRIESLPCFSSLALLRLIVAVPWTQLLHLAAVLSCQRMRTVVWRGVRYRIDGPWNIHVEEIDSNVLHLRASGENVSL